MRLPSWNNSPMTLPSACAQEQAEALACLGSPTQWWFWILAGTLVAGLATKGKR